jgi:hypothetical protein
MAMAPRVRRKPKYPKAVKQAHEAALQARLRNERAGELDALRARGAVAASGRRPLFGWFGQSANDRLEQHLVRSGRARSPAEIAANGADDPAASRREVYAGRILAGMERAANEGRQGHPAHFYSRHGAPTAIESHASRVVTGHGPGVPQQAGVADTVQTRGGLAVPASTEVGRIPADESSRFATNVRQLDAIGEAVAEATPHLHSLTKFTPYGPADPTGVRPGGYMPAGAADEPHQTSVERRFLKDVPKAHPRRPLEQIIAKEPAVHERKESRTTPLPFTGRLNVGVRDVKLKTRRGVYKPEPYGESVGLDPAANAPALGNPGGAIPAGDRAERAAALRHRANVRGATVILDVDPRGGFTPHTAFPNRAVVDTRIEAKHSGDVVTGEHTDVHGRLTRDTERRERTVRLRRQPGR